MRVGAQHGHSKIVAGSIQEFQQQGVRELVPTLRQILQKSLARLARLADIENFSVGAAQSVYERSLQSECFVQCEARANAQNRVAQTAPKYLILLDMHRAVSPCFAAREDQNVTDLGPQHAKE